MSASTINDFVGWLETLAPLELAEEWDNVGLLVGDRGRPAHRVMTCLTLSPATVAEAVERRADLVVVHHPLPFRPLAQVTTDEVAGRLLWDLIGSRVAVYSAHTAFDSAEAGINQRLALGLGLRQVTPLVPQPASALRGDLGSGRTGVVDPPLALADLAARARAFLSVAQVRVVGEPQQSISRLAVVCGSGGSFLPAARQCGCDGLLTGEASFHHCLEAEALGIGLILAGHFATERFAMDQLAHELREQFASVEVWASQRERDPLRSL